MIQRAKMEIERSAKEAGNSVASGIAYLLIEKIVVTDAAAELMLQDLRVKEMQIKQCADKMKSIARKKQKGGCYCIPPDEAEKIIRDFYGIPEAVAAPVEPETPKKPDIPAQRTWKARSLL